MNQTLKTVKVGEYRDYLNEVRGIERNYYQEIIHSRHNAWRVVTFLSVLLALSLLAIIALEITLAHPSKAFIMRVDNATGRTDVLSIMDDHKDSYGVVADKYWINQFVLNAESYNYHTIQHSYDLVGLLSNPTVAKSYQERFIGSQALDKVLKDTGTIVVNVHFIIPDEKDSTAIAHFSTITTMPGQYSGVQKNWIATIAYQYKNLPMSEADRLKNPLGFQVISYRVDPENFEHDQNVTQKVSGGVS